ncbi:MAG TPA: ubiquinol-cytochrome c reductase iron-sulfur subunit N-terminal domain-containing protein, partial [Enterovirga sp.]|nr:ubiquinol-cytochrome c reductase iron-sulfur subunit N-terminal domain-containing protein [Enterovirga sp.]
MATTAANSPAATAHHATRRDFLMIATGAAGAVGAAAVIWPF